MGSWGEGKPVRQCVRSTLPADYAEITSLARTRLHISRSVDETSLDFGRANRIGLTLANEQDTCTGYALGWVAGGTAELTEIAVCLEDSGCGYGRMLLSAFVAMADKRDAEEIHLEVRADNMAAIKLYMSEGFTVVGRRKGYYSDGSDALLYSLGLS